jgi:hypothetical protein
MAYLEAAKAILRRAPSARASASNATNYRRIPLPRKRPSARPWQRTESSKVFANAGAAETWSDENDPEGRGLDRDASEMAISDRAASQRICAIMNACRGISNHM